MTKQETAAAMSGDDSDEDWGDVDQTPQKSSQSKAKKRKPEPGDESEDCEDTEEDAEETGGSTEEGSDTEVEEEKPPPKAKPSAPKKRKADAPAAAKAPKKAPAAAKPPKAIGKPKPDAVAMDIQGQAAKAPRKTPAPKGPTAFGDFPLTKTDDGKYVREGMSAKQELDTYKKAMQAQLEEATKKQDKATTLATNGRNKNPKGAVQAFNGIEGAILSTAAQELYAQEQAEKHEPTPIELLQEAALKFAKATGITPTVTVNLTGSPRAL